MRVYERSGVVPFTGGMATVGIACVLAIALGAVYAFAVVWIPFVKLRFLITLAFGALLGGITGGLAKSLKIRNLTFVLGAYALATLLGYYVSWSVWPTAIAGWGQVGLRGFDPLVMMQFIPLAFQQGTWGIGRHGGAMTGWPLAAIWGVEAITIFSTSFWVLRAAYDDQPFCENCHQWTTTENAVRQLRGDGTESLWDQVRNGRLIVLNELMVATGVENTVVLLDLTKCDGCSGSKYMTARAVTTTVDKKGNVSTKEQPLVKNLVINDHEAEFVLLCGEPNPDAPVDEPVADPGPDEPK